MVPVVFVHYNGATFLYDGANLPDDWAENFNTVMKGDATAEIIQIAAPNFELKDPSAIKKALSQAQ